MLLMYSVSLETAQHPALDFHKVMKFFPLARGPGFLMFYIVSCNNCGGCSLPSECSIITKVGEKSPYHAWETRYSRAQSWGPEADRIHVDLACHLFRICASTTYVDAIEIFQKTWSTYNISSQGYRGLVTSDD